MTTARRCICGHFDDDHDAGECWVSVETGQCPCSWWDEATA